MKINDVSGQIVSAAMKVHTALGPGLFESTYQACMRHELQMRGLRVQHEYALPIIYGDMRIEIGYRVDLLFEDLVIVELKSVAKLLPFHLGIKEWRIEARVHLCVPCVPCGQCF